MRKFLLSALLFGAIFSCSNSNDDNRSDKNSNSNEAVLPVKIVENGSESVIKYNGAKITEVINSDGTKVIFTYDGDNIVKTSSYDEIGREITTEVFTYSNGKIASKTTTEVSSIGLPSEKKLTAILTYKWVDANHVTETSASNNGSNNILTDYYFSNGNIIKKIRNYSIGSIVSKTEYNYSYDTRNNPLKNVKGMEALMGSDYASNNLIKEEIKNSTTNSTESSSTTTYTNEYNNNNYIVKRVGKTVGVNVSEKETTTTYTYNK